MTGSIHLETDKIRKNRVVSDGQDPQYSSEESRKTYNTTFEIADEKFNNEGYSVVLDGTFNICEGEVPRGQAPRLLVPTDCFNLIKVSTHVHPHTTKIP